MKKKIAALLGAAAVAATLGACSAADRVNQNNRTAADNFEIERRIVFFNGITDSYLLEIQGRCSITDETGKAGGASQLEVICKTGEKEFKKHMLGLSDNTSYFVEQLEGADTSSYHYRVIFRPEEIIPDIDLETSVGSVG